ncbi:MAG: TetR/AcrR family transcriptional regulator [Hyphomicrobiales bacterium]|nr:TetR/AcrR family transcriptional regulator [Hyphomicrobiales bacterium]
MVTKRIRLAPKVRSEKILDSALAEFSQRGFAATRIEDIARGAGLAKSGFYAHFRSKEDVFKGLLTRYLDTHEVIPFTEGDTVADFVDRFIDVCYSRLVDPRRQAVLRLLLVEAHRIPELIGPWRREAAEPVMEAQRNVLRAAVARGQLAHALIVEDFQFAYCPVLYWVLASGALDPHQASASKNLDMHRKLHRQMMLALLCAPASTPEAGQPRQRRRAGPQRKAPKR